MKLSEAILAGSVLRPESHQERFCNVENRGLCSDVWGAACEAVHPQVARLNWNLNNKQALDSSLRYINEIQHRYFEKYFQTPARCPLAYRAMLRKGGRITSSRKGRYVIEGVKSERMPGVTDECHKVSTLAGLVDHAFYKHGNSREEIADIVAEAERMMDSQVITAANLITVEHFQSDQLTRKIAHQNTLAMRQRELNRRNGRRILAVN